MICPACRAKYPTGTLRCRKCGVLLAETSRDLDSRENSRDSPSLLWSGADAVFFSALVDALFSQGIPLHQSVAHDSAAGTFGRFPLGLGAHAAAYEIRVSGGDFDAAQGVMESVLTSSVEIAAEDEDGDAAQPAGAPSARGEWRAADAIAEVWRGEDGEWAFYLCDVLGENQIRARIASEPGAPARLLVRPVDEKAARGVLQAIEGFAAGGREA